MDTLNKWLKESLEREKQKKATLSVSLTFKGYISDAKNVPDKDGVYVAFARNIDNPQPPKQYDLVYIGIGNIKGRIGDHIREDYEKWAKEGCYSPKHEEIVYSYYELSYEGRLADVEKVLVNQGKPCYNSNYSCNDIESDYVSIHIKCAGNKGCLEAEYNWMNPKYFGK